MPTAIVDNRQKTLLITKVNVQTKEIPTTVNPADPLTGVIRPTIYANDSGSDATGDGTQAKPYRTLERACQDIPLYTGFDTHFINVTGLTQSWNRFDLPPWKSSRPQFLNFAPVVPGLIVEGAVNIYAETSVLETFNVTGSATDSSTGLRSYTDSSKALAVDSLKGKIAIGSDLFQFGIVASNTADTIEVASTGALTSPITIEDYGATLTKNTNNFPSGLYAVGNTAPVQFAGIKFENTSGGVSVICSGSQTEFYMCQIDGMAHSGVPATGQFHVANYFRTPFGGQVNPPVSGSLQRSFFDACSLGVNPNYSSSGFLQACIFDAPLTSIGNAGISTADNLSNMFVSGCLVRNGASHGFAFYGSGNNRISDSKADNCNGSALLIDRSSNVRIGSFGGSGNTQYGIELRNGSQCSVPAGLTVSGSLGELKSGSNVARTWVDFYGSAPIGEEVDNITQLTRAHL